MLAVGPRASSRGLPSQKRQECRFPEGTKRQECRFPEAPVLAVGPEGGWTDEEVERLEAKGFARMSLGPRILRTDTALIALISRLMESFDMNAATMAALPVNIA